MRNALKAFGLVHFRVRFLSPTCPLWLTTCDGDLCLFSFLGFLHRVGVGWNVGQGRCGKWRLQNGLKRYTVCLSSVCCGFLSSSLLCSNAGLGLLKNSATSVTHLPSNSPHELVRSLSCNCQNRPISTITEGYRWVSGYTPRSLYFVGLDGKLSTLQFFILQWIPSGTVNNSVRHLFRALTQCLGYQILVEVVGQPNTNLRHVLHPHYSSVTQTNTP